MTPKSRLNSASEFHYYKRNLPHFEQTGSSYFITFRTRNGMILSDTAKEVVYSSILFHADNKYKLYTCIVMEDHVHCILEPLPILSQLSTGRMSVPLVEYYSLAQITHSIKSYSANQVNKLLAREGSLWQDENYDRIIRDEIEFSEKMNYIIFNPVKAGLVNNTIDYKWLFVSPDNKVF